MVLHLGPKDFWLCPCAKWLVIVTMQKEILQFYLAATAGAKYGYKLWKRCRD